MARKAYEENAVDAKRDANARSAATGAGGSAVLAVPGLAARLSLVLLTLLRPAAAALGLLGRALLSVTAAVQPRGRSERQEQLLGWLAEARGSSSPVPASLSSVWRDGGLLCSALRAAVPGSCPDSGPPRCRCDFLASQHLVHKYLGVPPAFTEAEVVTAVEGRGGGADVSVDLDQRLEEYLWSVHREAARLRLVPDNPGVAWTPPPQAAGAADAPDEGAAGTGTAEAGEQVRPPPTRAKGTGLSTAIQGRKALFAVFVQPPVDDLLIQVEGPDGEFGQAMVRAASLVDVDSISQALIAPRRRAAFSLKPWFSVGSGGGGGGGGGGDTLAASRRILVEARAAPGGVRVSYVPRSAGHHQVSVLRRGRHVAESPYDVAVEPGARVRPGTPDYVAQWDEDAISAAAEGAAAVRTRDGRRGRIVFRVVDFVTEKMLLTDDGRLRRVPAGASARLMRALSLPSLALPSSPSPPAPSTPTPSTPSSDGPFFDTRSGLPSPATPSTDGVFYDSQSGLPAPAPSPEPPPPPPFSPSPDILPPQKTKRDPEFFRKKYRKVMHLCRFLASGAAGRRGLDILCTAGRVLDGRPVRLTAELDALLAQAIAEGQRHDAARRSLDVLTASVVRGRPFPPSPSPTAHGEDRTDNKTKDRREHRVTFKVGDDVIETSSRRYLESPVPAENNPPKENGKMKRSFSLEYKEKDKESKTILESASFEEANIQVNSSKVEGNAKEPTKSVQSAPIRGRNSGKSSYLGQEEIAKYPNEDLNVSRELTENKVVISKGDKYPATSHWGHEKIRTVSSIAAAKSVVRNKMFERVVEDESSGINQGSPPDYLQKQAEQLMAVVAGEDSAKSEELRSSPLPQMGPNAGLNLIPELGRRDRGASIAQRHTLPRALTRRKGANPYTGAAEAIALALEGQGDGETAGEMKGRSGQERTGFEGQSQRPIGSLKCLHASAELRPGRDIGEKDGGINLHRTTKSQPPNNTIRSSGSYENVSLGLGKRSDENDSGGINLCRTGQAMLPRSTVRSSERRNSTADTSVPQLDGKYTVKPGGGINLTQTARSSGPKRPTKLDLQTSCAPLASPSGDAAEGEPEASTVAAGEEDLAELMGKEKYWSMRRRRRSLEQNGTSEDSSAVTSEGSGASGKGEVQNDRVANLDSVLSAASLEEALETFEKELNTSDERDLHRSPNTSNSPNSAKTASSANGESSSVSGAGPGYGSSNGNSSSWGRGDSDYVSMDEVQSSLHQSPEDMAAATESEPDWTRHLHIDYDAETMGPAEREIWASMGREAVSNWVSGLVPQNRYHPRVLSPGVFPMSPLREESDEQQSPASPPELRLDAPTPRAATPATPTPAFPQQRRPPDDADAPTGELIDLSGAFANAPRLTANVLDNLISEADHASFDAATTDKGPTPLITSPTEDSKDAPSHCPNGRVQEIQSPLKFSGEILNLSFGDTCQGITGTDKCDDKLTLLDQEPLVAIQADGFQELSEINFDVPIAPPALYRNESLNSTHDADETLSDNKDEQNGIAISNFSVPTIVVENIDDISEMNLRKNSLLESEDESIEEDLKSLIEMVKEQSEALESCLSSDEDCVNSCEKTDQIPDKVSDESQTDNGDGEVDTEIEDKVSRPSAEKASSPISDLQHETESGEDIGPSSVRVAQWKQFWDQKVNIHKRKEEGRGSSCQRAIRRGTSHLEHVMSYLGRPASPTRKRMHPSIRIPGIVNKWRETFESALERNKTTKEILQPKPVKKRKSILASHNGEGQTGLGFGAVFQNLSPSPSPSETNRNSRESGETAQENVQTTTEWPKNDLVSKCKLKFEKAIEPKEENKFAYYKTIPPRRGVSKVSQWKKYWDGISKGESCNELNKTGTEQVFTVLKDIPIETTAEEALTKEASTTPKGEGNKKYTNIILEEIQAEKEKDKRGFGHANKECTKDVIIMKSGDLSDGNEMTITDKPFRENSRELDAAPLPSVSFSKLDSERESEGTSFPSAKAETGSLDKKAKSNISFTNQERSRTNEGPTGISTQATDEKLSKSEVKHSRAPSETIFENALKKLRTEQCKDNSVVKKMKNSDPEFCCRTDFLIDSPVVSTKTEEFKVKSKTVSKDFFESSVTDRGGNRGSDQVIASESVPKSTLRDNGEGMFGKHKSDLNLLEMSKSEKIQNTVMLSGVEQERGEKRKQSKAGSTAKLLEFKAEQNGSWKEEKANIAEVFLDVTRETTSKENVNNNTTVFKQRTSEQEKTKRTSMSSVVKQEPNGTRKEDKVDESWTFLDVRQGRVKPQKIEMTAMKRERKGITTAVPLDAPCACPPGAPAPSGDVWTHVDRVPVSISEELVELLGAPPLSGRSTPSGSLRRKTPSPRPAAAPGTKPEPRRKHLVAADDIWYRARRIPVEEADAGSSGSEPDDAASLSLATDDSTDQSWSVVEEGAESQPDSLTSLASGDGGGGGGDPAPERRASARTPGPVPAQRRPRPSREARSRFENAKLFFQTLEQTAPSESLPTSPASTWGRKRGRARAGGADFDTTSTDDTGSEGGTLRLCRGRRGRGGVSTLPRSAPASDCEGRARLQTRPGVPPPPGAPGHAATLPLRPRSRRRPAQRGPAERVADRFNVRGLFRDVAGGSVPHRLEVLASLAAVPRPVSPYEELEGEEEGDEAPAEATPLPAAYDPVFPHLPATPPCLVRPRPTLQSLSLAPRPQPRPRSQPAPQPSPRPRPRSRLVVDFDTI